MNQARANEINEAACQVWLFRHDLLAELPWETVELLKQCSTAQIQTATEYVDAANAIAMRQPGPKTIQCVVTTEAAAEVKAFVDALPHREN